MASFGTERRPLRKCPPRSCYRCVNLISPASTHLCEMFTVDRRVDRERPLRFDPFAVNKMRGWNIDSGHFNGSHGHILLSGGRPPLCLLGVLSSVWRGLDGGAQP